MASQPGIVTIRAAACAAALAAAAGLAHGQACGAAFYCTACSSPPPLVISPSDPGLNVSMKWSILTGSPSLLNPSWGFCPPGTFKDMLWRRHERASNCVLVAQANLNLRSGAIPWGDLMGNYYVQTDVDTSVGAVGDVNIVTGSELLNAWLAADATWLPFTGGVAKGIVIISANHLIDGSGASVARGVAVLGSISMPYVMMADPDVLCQRNERSLAHEVCHVLSLGHTGSGLMQSGGSSDVMTTAQANTARAYLIANLTQLDPPFGMEVGLIDAAVDGLDDAQRGHLDVTKTTVIDTARLDGKIALAVANGAPTDQQPIEAFIALDTDNDPGTGSPMDSLIPGMAFNGANFAMQIQIDPRGTPTVSLFRSFGAAWAEVKLFPGQIISTFTPIVRVVCDPTTAFTGPELRTLAHEAVITIDSTLISAVGPGGEGPAFPRGLRFQVATREGPGFPVADLGPNQPSLLRFPELLFPQLIAPRRVAPGDQMGVSVTHLPPQQGVKAFIGPTMFMPGVTTRADGSAEFTLTVPQDAPLGVTGLTVGVIDPDLAVTADRSITIVRCPADFNGDGIVDFSDYLEFLNLFDGGSEAADLNGDGIVDFSDYLEFLNLFDKGC